MTDIGFPRVVCDPIIEDPYRRTLLADRMWEAFVPASAALREAGAHILADCHVWILGFASMESCELDGAYSP